ncbi:MAG: GIY-YIG nuclease family protein [Candidatus Omnitrophota bacterium]
MWQVYVLEAQNGSLYTGITTNIDRRIQQHQAGTGARFTRGFGVKNVVYSEPCGSRSEALKREAAIKKLSRTEKLSFIYDE